VASQNVLGILNEYGSTKGCNNIEWHTEVGKLSRSIRLFVRPYSSLSLQPSHRVSSLDKRAAWWYFVELVPSLCLEFRLRDRVYANLPVKSSNQSRKQSRARKVNPITIPLPQESDLSPSHLPNLLPLTPILNTSGHARHAILKPVGQALQAVAYSFGACGVVDGLSDATTSYTDYATSCARDAADCCSELGGMSIIGSCFFGALCYMAYGPGD
jgi:hypothetical protein